MNYQEDLFTGARREAAERQVEAERAARLRDAGMESVLDNAGDWKNKAAAAIAELAGSGRTFTAEDVRAIVGDPPGHYNAMGAAIQAAAKRGEIRKIGYRRATRASLHATDIAEWEGIPDNERRQGHGE